MMKSLVTVPRDEEVGEAQAPAHELHNGAYIMSSTLVSELHKRNCHRHRRFAAGITHAALLEK